MTITTAILLVVFYHFLQQAAEQGKIDKAAADAQKAKEDSEFETEMQVRMWAKPSKRRAP